MISRTALLLTSAVLTTLFAMSAQADEWTAAATVSYVRTYDGTTWSIGLNGIICPNEKDYFYIYDRTNNNAVASVALAALAAQKRLLINYSVNADGIHCRVTGVWIEDD